jgi:hypothetical protein
MTTLNDAITSVGQTTSPVHLADGETVRWSITGTASNVGVALEIGQTLAAFNESRPTYGVGEGEITGPGYVRFRGLKVPAGQSAAVVIADAGQPSVRGSAWQAWEQADYDAVDPAPNVLHLIVE